MPPFNFPTCQHWEMREIILEAAPTSTTVAGQEIELLAYNGQFPGPTLRMFEGEHVRVRLVNRMGEPTNLHLHGLSIPPQVDDPRVLVNGGESRDYEFQVQKGSAGTYWYHPHGHGSVGPQLFAGLAGPLIVEPAGPRASGAPVEQHTLVVKDLAIADGRPAPHTAGDWVNGKEGDLILVNGERTPRIDTSGRSVRLRLINACNARYLRLQVQGQVMNYLGAGVGFAEKPEPVDSVLLAPGERADVAVHFEGAGDHGLVALPYDRGADMSGMANGATASHHVGEARLGNAEALALATSWRGPLHLRLRPPQQSRQSLFPARRRQPPAGDLSFQRTCITGACGFSSTAGSLIPTVSTLNAGPVLSRLGAGK